MVNIALLAALSTAIIATLAEWRHARRVARVARLAFGPGGAPAWWAHAAPVVRVIGLSAAVWGAIILAHWDPVETDVKPSPRASRQLLDQRPTPRNERASAVAGVRATDLTVQCRSKK